MAYATQQDLVDRFGEQELIQLSDRADTPTGEVGVAVVARALTDAAELIDGFLAGRYALPIASPPPVLTQLACDIARYKLHQNLPPELVRTNYQDALRQLKQIADGDFVLQAAGVGAAEAPDHGNAVVSGPGRVFSRKTLGSF
jgi:phage gp36-like protein